MPPVLGGLESCFLTTQMVPGEDIWADCLEKFALHTSSYVFADYWSLSN